MGILPGNPRETLGAPARSPRETIGNLLGSARETLGIYGKQLEFSGNPTEMMGILLGGP